MPKSSNHREISRKYRESNTINENNNMLIPTGFKNRLCHGPGERSAHRHGKPANEYKLKPGQWKMRNWKQAKVKTGSDCTANSGPFPNQYLQILDPATYATHIWTISLVFGSWWTRTWNEVTISLYIFIQLDGLTLTHWGRVTHICVGDPSLVQIMARRQAII